MFAKRILFIYATDNSVYGDITAGGSGSEMNVSGNTGPSVLHCYSGGTLRSLGNNNMASYDVGACTFTVGAGL